MVSSGVLFIYLLRCFQALLIVIFQHAEHLISVKSIELCCFPECLAIVLFIVKSFILKINA